MALLRATEQELGKFVAKARMDLGKVAFRIGDNGEVMQHVWEFLAPSLQAFSTKARSVRVDKTRRWRGTFLTHICKFDKTISM